MSYHVHKFGGTSVGNPERIKNSARLLSGKNEILVVSAMQHTTSILQSALDAARYDSRYLSMLDDLENTHLHTVTALLPDPLKSDLSLIIQNDFKEIKKILYAVQLIGTYPKEIQDIVLGYGETWSAQLLAHYLGQFHKTCYLNASTVLFVFKKNGLIYVDWKKSKDALQKFLNEQSFDQLIITGFIASTLNGKRTTLGRNGSDFSAAIFAKLFEAESLTIWTDVDGIYTADPNKVRSAFVIEALSYQEALELAYFGAKVLHPMTIAPAMEHHIPILIKNSFNPAKNGTRITKERVTSRHPIKGLTSIDDAALINIEGAGMMGVSGAASRVFQILHQAHISVILIAQASSEHSICFAVAAHDAKRAMDALHEQLQFEIEHHQIERIVLKEECGILSAVGDEMIGTVGVTAQLCNALADANVNILAISQGSSERNISIVIHRKNMVKALQAVHAGFYLSRKTLSVGIIGPGQVGKTLLTQIEQTLEKNILIRGIMNSKEMLLSHEPILLSDWEQHTSERKPVHLEQFIRHIAADDIPHAAIIDCTADPVIAKEYKNFLEHNIHIVTPNKHANAGDLNEYKTLKSIVQKKNKHYLYEATVCAGLPVINTLQDLIKTGDKIERIEGVLSGTLSFLFNEMAKNRLFSEVLLEAKSFGYTEPDPREDLSGMDVARKLICLAREMGLDTNLHDIRIETLLPSALVKCPLDQFLREIAAQDTIFSEKIAEAKQRSEKWCCVGSIEHNGNISIETKSFSMEHPFASLTGTDNMLIFYTQRYHTQPLVIRGPGAGKEVTAAGIFADVLRLISFLS